MSIKHESSGVTVRKIDKSSPKTTTGSLTGQGQINMIGKLYDIMSWDHFKIGFDQERGINKIISDILPSVGDAHLTEN